MKLLNHRRVKQGYSDKFSLTFDKETVSKSGLIFREPMDITGWYFELFFHKNVEMHCEDILFGLKGDVLDGKTGKVYFKIPDTRTNMKPGTYWYTLQIKKPNNSVTRSESAKFIIAESLNPYFSIYDKK